ncbi:MAG: hypothetical protein WCF30_06660 [Terracidiphilus sp.]
MAAPVWVLSVDLQTKTATFTTGLADAAKSARGSFQDIQGGAGAMGGSISGSMRSTRESVMLLGEEFGVHLPRALTSFIAGLGPVGAAMEAAFPFIALAALAGILVAHLEKLKEAGVKLTQDQMSFGTAVQNAFNTFDEKILEAQIRADDLKDNHLAGIKDQLKLIDMQSMEELVHSFETVAKAADVVLKDLEGHWYTFGKGSDGAKAALDAFQVQYASLMAQGKGDEAHGLLTGTLAQAREVAALQDRLRTITTGPDSMSSKSRGQQAEADAIREQLKAKGASADATDNEVAAQQNLVQALQAQVGLEQRAADLKALDASNTKAAAAKADARTGAAAAAKEAEEENKGRALYLSELFQTNREAVSAIQQGEKETIDATKDGTAERLAAIQDAMAAERAMGLEDSDFYKQLAVQEVEVTRQMTEEQARLKQQAGDEEARHDEATAQQIVAAQRGAQALLNSTRRTSAAEMLAQDTLAANESFAVKYVALAKEIDALDKSGADYDNKLKALQDKETELVKQHEDQITQIKERAEQERNVRILGAEQQLGNSIARELTQTLMGHQSFAKMMNQLGNQVVSSMIENSIKIMLQQDKERMGDARKAATSAYATGEKIGGPAGVILGPVFAAAAFAGVMAFAQGGIVPGVDGVDSVPTMLTPGEGVVPRGVMDQLSDLARNGGLQGGGPHYHVTTHVHMNASALDSDGMDAVLNKHADTLQRHFERTLRKMNR